MLLGEVGRGVCPYSLPESFCASTQLCVGVMEEALIFCTHLSRSHKLVWVRT